MLQPIQKSLIIGTLLGDGCLLSNASGTNYRLQIAHGEKQKQYLWWKYILLKNWVLSSPVYYAKNRAWRFRTLSHATFTELRQEFYCKALKIIPEDIYSILRDPFALAVWYMDDGTRFHNGGYTLNTQSFTKKENERLVKSAKEIYNWHWTLHGDRGRHRIYIGKKEAKEFRELIEPYIFPSLRYKL